MNKKGFTLIELLAVILILGIIALIAIPVVSNILKETRLGAFNTTVQNFEKAAVMACQRNQINDKDTINLVIVEGKLNVDIDRKSVV